MTSVLTRLSTRHRLLGAALLGALALIGLAAGDAQATPKCFR